MSQVLEVGSAERRDRERPVATDHRLAIGVIVTGLVAVFGTSALEPAAPHHAESSWVVVATIGETVFFGLAFLGAYALLKGRSRLGYTGIAGASYVLLGLVIGCPASGHHAFGAWWAGQMALALAFAMVSTVAAKVSRPGSRRAAL